MTIKAAAALLAALLAALPGVTRCLVQHTEGLWPEKTNKNSGGGWDVANTDLHEIRAGIGKGDVWQEATHATLKGALTAVLTAHGFAIPPEISALTP